MLHKIFFFLTHFLGFFLQSFSRWYSDMFHFGTIKEQGHWSCSATPFLSPCCLLPASIKKDVLGRNRNVIGRACSSELDFLSSHIPPQSLLISACKQTQLTFTEAWTLQEHTKPLEPPSSFLFGQSCIVVADWNGILHEEFAEFASN